LRETLNPIVLTQPTSQTEMLPQTTHMISIIAVALLPNFKGKLESPNKQYAL